MNDDWYNKLRRFTLGIGSWNAWSETMNDDWYNKLRRGEGKEFLTAQWLAEQPARQAWEALVGDKRVYCHVCNFKEAEHWRSDSQSMACNRRTTKLVEQWRHLYHCPRHAQECIQRMQRESER